MTEFIRLLVCYVLCDDVCLLSVWVVSGVSRGACTGDARPGCHAVISRALRAGWLPSRLFVALLTAVWSTPVIPGVDVPAPNTLLFI